MKIPYTVMGLGGPIAICIVSKLKHAGVKCSGVWYPDKRLIKLKEDIDSEMNHSYFHELVHAACYDSGFTNFLTNEQEEALCDAIAMARLRELEST